MEQVLDPKKYPLRVIQGVKGQYAGKLVGKLLLAVKYRSVIKKNIFMNFDPKYDTQGFAKTIFFDVGEFPETYKLSSEVLYDIRPIFIR